MKILYVVALLASLTACGATTQIAQFTAADAGNAAAMAGRDTIDMQASSRAGCYNAFGNVAGGVANTPANASGIFTGVEAGIEIQSTIQIPACQAIAGQVLMWAVRKAPGGNLLPF